MSKAFRSARTARASIKLEKTWGRHQAKVKSRKDKITGYIAELEKLRAGLRQCSAELEEAANIIADSKLPGTSGLFRIAAQQAFILSRQPTAYNDDLKKVLDDLKNGEYDDFLDKLDRS